MKTVFGGVVAASLWAATFVAAQPTSAVLSMAGGSNPDWCIGFQEIILVSRDGSFVTPTSVSAPAAATNSSIVGATDLQFGAINATFTHAEDMYKGFAGA